MIQSTYRRVVHYNLAHVQLTNAKTGSGHPGHAIHGTAKPADLTHFIVFLLVIRALIGGHVWR